MNEHIYAPRSEFADDDGDHKKCILTCYVRILKTLDYQGSGQLS